MSREPTRFTVSDHDCRTKADDSSNRSNRRCLDLSKNNDQISNFRRLNIRRHHMCRTWVAHELKALHQGCRSACEKSHHSLPVSRPNSVHSFPDDQFGSGAWVVWTAKSVIGGAGGFHARRRVRMVVAATSTVVSVSTRRSP